MGDSSSDEEGGKDKEGTKNAKKPIRQPIKKVAKEEVSKTKIKEVVKHKEVVMKKEVAKAKLEKKEVSKPKPEVKAHVPKPKLSSGCMGDSSSEDEKPVLHKYEIYF
jgi:hypothetical protein